VVIDEESDLNKIVVPTNLRAPILARHVRRVNGEPAYSVHFFASDANVGHRLLRSCRTCIARPTKLSKFDAFDPPDEAGGKRLRLHAVAPTEMPIAADGSALAV
jgi:hypothetical protein